MKLLVINGSPTGRDGYTTRTVAPLLDALRRQGDLTVSEIYLGEQALGLCQGHLSCVKLGEDHCPYRSQVTALEQAMHAADAVVFASPVHCFNVSALTKNFIDLFVYQMHRPDFFTKKAVVVTTAAGAGQKKVLDYLEKTVANWGFHVVGRLGTHTGLFDEPKYQARLEPAADRLAARLRSAVASGRRPAPGLGELIGFRVWRSVITRTGEQSPYDWAQWQSRGWLERDYYLDMPVNAFFSGIAALVERLIGRAINKVTVGPVS